MKNVIAIDIDDVLSNTDARQHLKDEDWSIFHSALGTDTVNETARAIIQGLSDGGYEIIVCTGRPARYDLQTIAWLSKHEIPADEVLMRQDNDYRSDAEVKIDLLTNYFGSLEEAKANVLLYLDKSDKTIEALRNLGFEAWSVR